MNIETLTLQPVHDPTTIGNRVSIKKNRFFFLSLKSPFINTVIRNYATGRDAREGHVRSLWWSSEE